MFEMKTEKMRKVIADAPDNYAILPFTSVEAIIPILSNLFS